MANKVITMQQIRSIIQLLEKGYSLRSISAQIGLSREPVTFYAARLKNAPYSLEALPHVGARMRRGFSLAFLCHTLSIT
ncbi:MAG TPA: hypothetical protein VN726_23160 [Hanamia sp.]|nr:hypothetical protein [Hanamia sp.]